MTSLSSKWCVRVAKARGRFAAGLCEAGDRYSWRVEHMAAPLQWERGAPEGSLLREGRGSPVTFLALAAGLPAWFLRAEELALAPGLCPELCPFRSPPK